MLPLLHFGHFRSSTLYSFTTPMALSPEAFSPGT